MARQDWFKQRKYSGWGLTPKTWQGWVYILVMIIPLVIFQSLPFWDSTTRLIVTFVWIGIFIVDISYIMITIKRDERDRLHEALAERNALWVIMAVLIVAIGYQAARSVVLKSPQIDWFIVAALLIGVIVKAISNLWLDRKD